QTRQRSARCACSTLRLACSNEQADELSAPKQDQGKPWFERCTAPTVKSSRLAAKPLSHRWGSLGRAWITAISNANMATASTAHVKRCVSRMRERLTATRSATFDDSGC